MRISEAIVLKRACEATEIPSGNPAMLPMGALVRVTQSLGNSYTVTTDRGYLYRIDEQNADALGFSRRPGAEITAAAPEALKEEMVWNELRSVYDPEIPVNIVDLGLVYSCVISDSGQQGKKIEIKMAMTAPGCGMGNVIKSDVENRLSRLPQVEQVQVEIVFDPPWHPGRMSEAAKLQLGLDLG